MYTCNNENNVKNATYHRGNIVYADLGQPVGSEQGGIRPCLIVQNDVGNKHSPCLIILPMTKSKTKHRLPTHIYIELDNVYGIAYGEQIRTIDKKRVDNIRGVIDHIDNMQQINKALIISLALEGAC